MPQAEKRLSHFVVNSELLKVRGEVAVQLLAPSPFRCMVLDLVHDASECFQRAKETGTDWFYWSGITAVKYYSSYPTCQITAPGTYFGNPFMPLSIIKIPVEMIVMDLVGLLVK